MPSATAVTPSPNPTAFAPAELGALSVNQNLRARNPPDKSRPRSHGQTSPAPSPRGALGRQARSWAKVETAGVGTPSQQAAKVAWAPIDSAASVNLRHQARWR